MIAFYSSEKTQAENKLKIHISKQQIFQPSCCVAGTTVVGNVK